MPDVPETDLGRVAGFVREDMCKDEDYDAGQDMLSTLKAIGRLPSVGARSIKGLSPGTFDGDMSFLNAKANLEINKDAHESRLRKKKGV